MLEEDWRKSFIRESCNSNTMKVGGAIKKLIYIWAYDILEEEQDITDLTALAGIIMENFYNKHLPKLIKATKNSVPDEDYSETWNLMKIKLKSQIDLRIMSCLQLASKMVFHRNFNGTLIQDFLNEHKETKISLKKISLSEIRVFKTINYEVPLFSSSDIIEFLIEVTCADYSLYKQYIYQISYKTLNLIFYNEDPIPNLKHGCQSEVCNLWNRMSSSVSVLLAMRIMSGDNDGMKNSAITKKVVEAMECDAEDIDAMSEYFMQIILK